MKANTHPHQNQALLQSNIIANNTNMVAIYLYVVKLGF
jgi:hypothetical protein